MDLRNVSGSAASAGGAGMWRVGHRRVRATAWVRVAWALMIGLAAGGHGQAGVPVIPAEVRDVRDVHRMVESWLIQDQVDTLAAAELNRGDVLAVAVTLRESGIVVGFGEAVRADFTQQAMPVAGVSMTQLAAAAAERAFAGARDRLELAPPGSDVPDARRLSDVASFLQVDVQVAHAPRELLLADEDPTTALLNRFVVGYHGLLLADDLGTTHALSWPSQAIQANRDGVRVLRALMSAWGAPVDDWRRMGRPLEQQVHRFEVFHVVRTAPTLDPQPLTRGQVQGPPRAVDAATLRALADGFAEHLTRHIAVDTVRGTYNPTAGSYEPAALPDAPALFVAGALLRHAAWVESQPGGSGRRQAQAWAATARGVVGAVVERRLADRPAARPLDLSLAVFAWAEGGVTDRDAATLEAYAQTLADRMTDDGQFRAGDEARTPDADEAQAIAVAALASAARALGSDALRADARRALTALWALEDRDADADGTPDGLGVGVTVWLAVAQQRLEASGAAIPPDPAGRLARQVQLITQQQVLSLPGLGPLDVYGGIEFEPGPPGSAPRPDWRTGQALWLFAAGLRSPTTLADPRANPLDWTFSAELAARFLAQLRFDEYSAYYVTRPALAIGGLRTSLTDHRLDPMHSALALHAMLELLERLDDAEAARQATAP